MPTKILIPTPLRPFTDKLDAVEIDGSTIGEALQNPQMLLDLLGDATVACNVLPLVVRSLFWSGDLKIAVRAIQYLAAESSSGELDTIVDAALTDLLGRLEVRVDTDDQESTAAIIGKILDISGFERLPAAGPMLLVGNHSGGWLVPDTGVFFAAWYRERGLVSPLIGLAFDAAFGIPGFRSLMRRMGEVPASRENAFH